MLSSSPSVSISISSRKARSITRLAYPLSVRQTPITAFDLLQRRNYADEAAATQSEPEADGATEAEHGNNSIAASADPDADVNAPLPAENAEEESKAALTVESATERATDSVRSATQTATETVTGAAQSLAAAAGYGNQPSEPDREAPKTSKVVYVGNLFFDVKEEDLKKEFERAGPVVEVKIIMDPRGLSKGFVQQPPFAVISCYTHPIHRRTSR